MHLVVGHPGERQAIIAVPSVGSVAKHHLVRDTCPLPCLVRAPGLRRVEPETGHVRGRSRTRRTLRSGNFPRLPGDPGVLAGHPTVAVPWFSSAVSSRTTIASGVTQACQDNRCSAAMPRRGMPGLLRQLPARLASPRSAAAAPWPARQWDASSPGEVSPARRHLPRWRPSHIARDAGHHRIILPLGHTRTVIPGC